MKGIYLYCIAAADRIEPPDCKGVGDAPVKTERIGGLAVLYSDSSIEDFTGPSGDENLKNLDWISPRAMAHGKVVEGAMKNAPVYPTGFGTLFSTMEELEKRLQPHLENISAFLLQVDGKEEYAVKFFLDRKKAGRFISESLLFSEQQAVNQMSPGKKYLAERQLRKKIDGKVNALAKTNCENLIGELTRQFEEYVERKPFAGEPSGDSPEMVFNLAFLVRKIHAAYFTNIVETAKADLGARGLIVSATGPWPPYSFCAKLENAEHL